MDKRTRELLHKLYTETKQRYGSNPHVAQRLENAYQEIGMKNGLGCPHYVEDPNYVRPANYDKLARAVERKRQDKRKP